MATGTIQQVLNESDPGYCKMPDGTLICWGLASNTSSGYAEITFPTQFTGTNYSFVATPAYGYGYNTYEIRVITQSSWSTGGFVYFRNFDANTPYTSTNAKAHWIAIGRWKA